MADPVRVLEPNKSFVNVKATTAEAFVLDHLQFWFWVGGDLSRVHDNDNGDDANERPEESLWEYEFNSPFTVLGAIELVFPSGKGNKSHVPPCQLNN